MQFYSETATQFRYFKNAWRNHVSHSNATYDEAQAEKIMTQQTLAVRAKP